MWCRWSCGIRIEQIVRRVPQHHRHHIDPAVRFFAAHRDEITGETAALFELADLGRRSQAATEHYEVEVHEAPFRGRRDTGHVMGGL